MDEAYPGIAKGDIRTEDVTDGVSEVSDVSGSRLPSGVEIFDCAEEERRGSHLHLNAEIDDHCNTIYRRNMSGGGPEGVSSVSSCRARLRACRASTGMLLNPTQR